VERVLPPPSQTSCGKILQERRTSECRTLPKTWSKAVVPRAPRFVRGRSLIQQTILYGLTRIELVAVRRA